MLNGQLQLTDTALARPCRACAVRFISRAPSAWSSWPVALPRASAPRGRHGRRAADHRDGPAWRQLRRRRATRSTRSRVRTTSTSRTSSAGTISAIPTRFRWARCSSCPVAAPRPAARRRSRRWPRQVVLDAAAPLDQPSDSGAATSTPSTATPAPAPTPAENRRARPMPASSTGAGRPPARSPRASTTTPRASTSPATWATPSSRRPTARSCTAATACAAWAT